MKQPEYTPAELLEIQRRMQEAQAELEKAKQALEEARKGSGK